MQIRGDSIDYSYTYPAILFTYFKIELGNILLLGFSVYFVFTPKKEYIKGKKVGDLLGALFFVVLAIIIVSMFANELRDIPNIVNKNYVVTTGASLEPTSSERGVEFRGFRFKPDNEEIAPFRVYAKAPPVHPGDRFEIIYLPVTKLGVVIRRLT